MPTLNVYPQARFPLTFQWQAVSFMRCEWPSIFAGELEFLSETYPAELDPVHFVAAEGDVLLSYAAAIRLRLEHMGRLFSVYGFGNMFTFPPYRGRDYGKQLLNLATDYILQSDVDVSILFCDATLEPFYAKSGWQTTSSPTRFGTSEQYTPYENVIRMMHFVSASGKQYQKLFIQEPVYVETPW